MRALSTQVADEAAQYAACYGSLDAIRSTIANGVPEPKQHPGAMPPMGGVTLSKDEVNAVVAYVWALGHRATR